MNKITAFLVITVISLSIILGATIQSKAQNKNFAGVLPFITTTNRVGFFNQNNGKIYMYDSNINQCLFIGQLTELGQAIQEIPKSQ
jgi:hypothetical protein